MSYNSTDRDTVDTHTENTEQRCYAEVLHGGCVYGPNHTQTDQKHHAHSNVFPKNIVLSVIHLKYSSKGVMYNMNAVNNMICVEGLYI